LDPVAESVHEWHEIGVGAKAGVIVIVSALVVLGATSDESSWLLLLWLPIFTGVGLIAFSLGHEGRFHQRDRIRAIRDMNRSVSLFVGMAFVLAAAALVSVVLA
jgi:hypothetical protein